MALSIQSLEAEWLARELARVTGEGLDEAVTNALRERLERERRKADVEAVVKNAMAIGKHFCSLPILDSRSADAILGYDKCGIPS